MKVIDVIGFSLVVIGLVLTILLFIAARHPSDIESVTFQEIPSPVLPHDKGI